MGSLQLIEYLSRLEERALSRRHPLDARLRPHLDECIERSASARFESTQSNVTECHSIQCHRRAQRCLRQCNQAEHLEHVPPPAIYAV